MANTPVKRSFIDSKFGQLHLRSAGKPGSKLATICLHMVPKSSRGLAKLLPELAVDRLVLAPDYPGYGESDGFPAGVVPRIDDYADAVEEVVEAYQLEQVNLLGYHTGSMVAVALAHRRPELVCRVINLSAPILTEQEVADFKAFFSTIPLDKEGTRFRIMWERVVKFAGPGMSLEMAADSMAENLRGGDRYEDGHDAAFDYASRYAEQLQELQQPILVMNFGDDLFEYSKRVDPYLNNGSRVDYPDWGHGCLELYPREVAAQALQFFDQS